MERTMVCHCSIGLEFDMFVFSLHAHRAMFKLGGKKLFVLCLLVKNVSAVYSADRCDFSMLNSSCYWISSGPHGS